MWTRRTGKTLPLPQLLALTALSTLLTMSVLTWADCGSLGTPYCWDSDVVPCNPGTCTLWSVAFPSLPAPDCDLDPVTLDPIPVARVDINVTAKAWLGCFHSTSDDEDTCATTPATCANYVSYPDSSCAFPCPIAMQAITYCQADPATSDACK